MTLYTNTSRASLSERNLIEIRWRNDPNRNTVVDGLRVKFRPTDRIFFPGLSFRATPRPSFSLSFFLLFFSRYYFLYRHLRRRRNLSTSFRAKVPDAYARLEPIRSSRLITEQCALSGNSSSFAEFGPIRTRERAFRRATRILAWQFST